MSKSDKPGQNGTAGTLEPAQETALAALLAGKGVTEAAAAAGVDRRTVHRWRTSDYEFMAEYNRRKWELRGTLSGRLMNLADKATAAVEKAIDEGDSKTALALLKGLGLLNGEPPVIGSSDPEDLRIAEKERQYLQTMRACM